MTQGGFNTTDDSLPLVLIAARMASSRLPSKALMDFGGKPLIGHVVSAASTAKGTAGVVVVTSTHPTDDALVKWCHSHRVEVWRGDLDDVACRMLGAASDYAAVGFVRISGDSPMIDPTLITYAARRFVSGAEDVVTNVSPRAFPPGQSVEVIRTQVLARLLQAEHNYPGDREHVTPVLYRHEDQISIGRFTPIDVPSNSTRLNGPYRSMTIDNQTDADCFRHVLAKEADVDTWKFGWRECGFQMHLAQLRLTTSCGPCNES